MIDYLRRIMHKVSSLLIKLQRYPIRMQTAHELDQTILYMYRDLWTGQRKAANRGN